MVAVLRRAALVLALVIGLAGHAVAMPDGAPVNRSLTWDHAGGALGFWIYAAPNLPGRTYSDARRYQIQDGAARSVIVLDLSPDNVGGVCFQATAYYEPDGTEESPFSNETCGRFGINAPFNLGGVP